LGRRLSAIREFRRLAMARGNIYYLLSQVFLSKPSYKLVTNVLNKDFLYGISHVVDDDRGVKLLRRFAAKFTHDKESYENLTREYEALFLSSGARYVRPYESAYIDYAVLNDIKSMYRAARVQVSRLRNYPDHFGLELWFMYHLCYSEAQAWSKRVKDVAISYLEFGKRFLEKHLMRWSDSLCNRIYNLSRSDFYRGVADITKGYIEQDYRELKEVIKEAEDLT